MTPSQTFDSSCWTTQIATVSSDPGESIRINYIDCPPATSKGSKGVILLIHGFPQTSYQFRHVINPLSDHGYRVIAPDYRGAGPSSKPKAGYEKSQMAKDLYVLVHDYLKIEDKIHVVGHDIGGMIAWAYASRYSDHVASLVWGECPLPGTKFYDEVKGTPDVFHFVFHQVPDLPEALIAGKEDIYLKHFYDKICFNSSFLTQEDFDVYVTAFSQPGAIRAGLEVYRAFEKDAQENRKWLEKNGKLKVPTLGMFGGAFLLAEQADSMLKEVNEAGYETTIVEESGHYIAEEKPKDFVNIVLEFTKKHEW